MPKPTEFSCRDKDHILITCSKEQWQYLIKHKEMENQQGVVKAVIESPDFINQSKNHKNRKTFYKQLVLKDIGSTYLRVVIEYKTNLLGLKRGYVINAFSCDGAQKGEQVIWKKE
jgi:hypothetical protein